MNLPESETTTVPEAFNWSKEVDILFEFWVVMVECGMWDTS